MHFVRRGRSVAVLVASLVAVATIGAACTVPSGSSGGSPQPPAQPVFDWMAKAQTIHIVDDNNDNFACDGVNLNCDEPYLFHLAFRVQYGVPGSAQTWVVEDRPNEIKCPGSPPSVLGLQPDSCKSGESAPVPAAQGEILFQDLKGSDFINLLFGQLPEIAGVITFAFEEDILSNANPDTTLLQELVRGLLEDIIANGNIPTGDGGASGANDAALAIVADLLGIFGEFITSAAINLLADVGLFDDFVGLTPTVIAGVTGGLAGLVEAVEIDGTTFEQIPVLNGNVFTTASPASFSSTYTQQVIEVGGASIPIGASDTNYLVDWTVGQP